MAKIIGYRFLAYEKPEGEPVFSEKQIICDTKAQFDANLPLARAEAVEGAVEISGEFETEMPTDKERIAELEAALELLLSGVTE